MAPLTDEQRALIRKAREKAFLLYEGRATPHRSCGIALAETFGLRPQPYQALRRGGITGEGECGAIKAGELVLGELLGDPDPTGAVTEALRNSLTRYQRIVRERADFGKVRNSIVCNDLTGQFPAFQSAERLTFCTNIAAVVAECVAEALIEAGFSFDIAPISESSS